VISRDNADVNCGPFTLSIAFDSAEKDSVISESTSLVAIDATSINFSSTQSNLNDKITYEVQVQQEEYGFSSPAGYLTLTVRTCDFVITDWVTAQDP
jgi:hypothetical protein